MIRSLRLPAASVCALALALIVAACGSSATATPTPTPAGGGGGVLPSGLGGSGGLLGGLLGQNNNPTLQAKLPTQICGAPALTFSMPAGVLPAAALSGLAGGAGSLLSGISGTETFSFAMAGPGPAATDPCPDVTYFAVQISNGDANSFVQLMLQANKSDGGSDTTTSLGGKSVTVVTDSGGSKTYFTVNGDTAIGVQASDDATATAAFAALP
jgi:hypothetical protein